MKKMLVEILHLRKAAAPWDDIAPVREELFGVERLEQHAESLAAAQGITASPPPGSCRFTNV
ncbi:hypothetical protein ABK905_16545 [Acerihabitans sp. KWT182]|uniref:Uncharacterized protein n=1 Tax=Acerihabitans sp. KWT182 TaxID=3157919 RepID=A0AAU7Q5C3_9GAMM